MDEGFARGKDLLAAADVAEYLGVEQTTIQRWCREGSLPCMKIGKEWRIRREGLERFLERSERSETLVGRLRSFLEVPDNVLAITQDRQMMHRLDAAFFRVGETRGGTLIKYAGGEPWDSPDDLRTDLESHGLEVGRLEEEDRFRFPSEPDPQRGRTEEVRRLLSEELGGRSVWVSFNWAEQVDPDAALRQQEALQEVVEGSVLVVKTAVLEEVVDGWPGKMLRRTQVAHSGTIWLSEQRDGRELRFDLVKAELVSRLEFPSREAAKTAIFDYLETFYNTRRLHSALGYRSPADFEEDRMEEAGSLKGCRLLRLLLMILGKGLAREWEPSAW
jgi:excisionase family DNA binding protein